MCIQNSREIEKPIPLLPMAIAVALAMVFIGCGPNRIVLQQRDEIAALKEDIRILDGLYERASEAHCQKAEMDDDGMAELSGETVRQTDAVLFQREKAIGLKP